MNIEMIIKLNVSLFSPPSLPLPNLSSPSLKKRSQYLALTDMEVTKQNMLIYDKALAGSS